MLEGIHLTQQPYLDKDDFAVGEQHWEAPASGTVPVKSMAYKMLLQHAFGGVTEAGAGPYTHTYTPQTTLLSTGLSLTQYLGDGAKEIKASGGRIKSLEWSVNSNGLVEWKASLHGATYEAAAIAGAPSFSLETPPYFDFTHATVTMNSAGAGANPFACNGFNLSLDFLTATGQAEAYTLGSAVPTALDSTGIRGTGSFTRRHTADGTHQSAYLGYFLAKTAFEAVITLSGGADKTCVFTLQGIFGQPTRSGTGVITETIPFTLCKNDDTPVTIVITDDETGPS